MSIDLNSYILSSPCHFISHIMDYLRLNLECKEFGACLMLRAALHESSDMMQLARDTS